MRWRLILKNKKNQPQSGVYSDWKELIANECFNQCVYCSIHEQQFGGIDHYHIDHYRPKSIKEFEALKDDIMNLFYACPICNRFKHDDWPGEPTSLDIISYPNPSEIDYSTLFELSPSSYLLSGKYVASNYLIERLFLNRPQLVYERREMVLKKKETILMSEINNLIQQTDDVESLKMALDLTIKIRQHLAKREEIRPYTLAEIKKPGVDKIKQAERKGKKSKTEKKRTTKEKVKLLARKLKSKNKKSKINTSRPKQALAKSKNSKPRKSKK